MQHSTEPMSGQTEPAAGGGSRAFVLLTTRCTRGSCRRVFIGSGPNCERCERRNRAAHDARKALAEVRRVGISKRLRLSA